MDHHIMDQDITMVPHHTTLAHHTILLAILHPITKKEKDHTEENSGWKRKKKKLELLLDKNSTIWFQRSAKWSKITKNKDLKNPKARLYITTSSVMAVMLALSSESVTNVLFFQILTSVKNVKPPSNTSTPS